ncbi:MAG TPA: GDP-mannose 4,6-dehydratase [Longimicrobiales bacterium]|nr:GDP-mannose 4,6-dehydratase [Longimicrobiales bacterium]
MPAALITGITGQDGSYLAEQLLDRGYRVVGLTRRTTTGSIDRIRHIQDRIELVSGDLLDFHSLESAVRLAEPDEVYNLAAQSFVQSTWSQPELTGQTTALGLVRLLEAVRAVRPDARVYQASTSEIFGKVSATPQDEATPFHPRSPYGIAKLYAHWTAVNYRERYGMYVVSGILFNHESPRRGHEFVTRKVSHGVAAIHLGQQRELRLGNLDARRDWGFAGDYVDAMWRMLQQPSPQDLVVGTGIAHSVRDLVAAAFAHVGLDWRDHVVTDPAFVRPPEAEVLVADPRRANAELDWYPRVDFRQLVTMMVDADVELARRRMS